MFYLNFIMKKILMLSFLLVVFAGKMSFAQDFPDGPADQDSYFNNLNDPFDGRLINDFYLVGDVDNHYYMEAQNYTAPANSATVTEVNISITAGNDNNNDTFSQELSSYPDDVIGDVNMDIYDFVATDWDHISLDWRMFYSDGTFEWYHQRYDYWGAL